LKARYDGVADRVALSPQGDLSPGALAELVAATAR
jgi:hypothetical protein